MNRELAQPVSVGRKNRWYGPGVSAHLDRLEIGTVPKKQTLNWDRVLGLATVLALVGLVWTAVGYAAFHLFR